MVEASSESIVGWDSLPVSSSEPGEVGHSSSEDSEESVTVCFRGARSSSSPLSSRDLFRELVWPVASSSSSELRGRGVPAGSSVCLGGSACAEPCGGSSAELVALVPLVASADCTWSRHCRTLLVASCCESPCSSKFAVVRGFFNAKLPFLR